MSENSDHGPVDKESFHSLVALLGGDIDLLIDQFIEQSQQLLATVGRIDASSQQEEAAARLIAELHKLKGSALSLHCGELVQQCEQLSSAVNEPASNKSLISTETKAAFCRCVERTCSELKRLADRS